MKNFRFFGYAGIAFVGLMVLQALKSVYPGFLWFSSLGYVSVWWRVWQAQSWVFTGVFLVGVVWLFANLWAADRLSLGTESSGIPRFETPFVVLNRLLERWAIQRRERPVLGVISVLIRVISLVGAAVVALGLMGHWEDFYRALYSVPWGKVDPIFGHDLSFYMFVLPILKRIQYSVGLLLVITVGATLWIYVSRNVVVYIFGSGVKNRGMQVHLLGLAAVVMVVPQV